MKPRRVDTLVHPLGFFQMGIFADIEGVRHPEGGLVVVDGPGLGFDAEAEIVVDADEVRFRRLQCGGVLRLGVGVKPVALQVGGHVGRIGPVNAHIQQIELHQFLGVGGGQHILTAAGLGVDHLDSTDRADLSFRVDLTQQRNGFVLCQRDVVAHLIDVLQVLLGIRFVVTAEHPRCRGDELLVDSSPHLDTAFEMGEADLSVPQVGVHHLAAAPAAEGIHRRLGALKVVEGHKGLDALLQQIVDEPVVKGQPLGVGNAGIVRHDAAPGEAHTVDFQAQFGHQVHVLFPVVVVVGGHPVVRNAGAVRP